MYQLTFKYLPYHTNLSGMKNRPSNVRHNFHLMYITHALQAHEVRRAYLIKDIQHPICSMFSLELHFEEMFCQTWSSPFEEMLSQTWSSPFEEMLYEGI